MHLRLVAAIALLPSLALADWSGRDLGYSTRGLHEGVEYNTTAGSLYDLYDNPLWQAVANQYRGGYLRLDASAGVVSDLDVAGAVTGAVEASWDLPICRVLGGAAAGQLGQGDGDALASWSTTATACLPLPMNTFWFAYTHGENIRLSLFERAATLRERVSTDSFVFGVRFFRWVGETNEIAVMPVDAHVDYTLGPTGLGGWSGTFRMSMVRWLDRKAGLGDTGRTLAFFEVQATDVQNHDAPRSATAGEFVFARLDNQRLTSHLGLSAAAGIAHGLTFDNSMVVGHDDYGNPRYATLVSSTGLYADAALHGLFGRWSGTLRGTRSTIPLYDAQLVKDDRLAGHVAFTSDAWTARGEGFLARQRVMRASSEGRVLAGGGALELSWAPRGPLSLVGRTEAGRTLTVAPSSDPLAMQWDVRATVGLQARYSAQWPRR